MIENQLGMGIFEGLSQEQLSKFKSEMVCKRYALGASIEREMGEKYCVVLSGELVLFRGDVEIMRLRSNEGFGLWGMWSWLRTGFELRCFSETEIGYFEVEAVEKLMGCCSSSILKIFRNVSRMMESRVEDISMALLSVYSAPSQHVKTNVTLKVNGSARLVRIGTPLSEVLPREHEGSAVLAGLLNYKPVSLNRPMYMSGVLEPVTRRSLEGRSIYRRSLDLLAVEACYRVDPRIKMRVGPSLGFAHILEIEDYAGHGLDEIAARLNAEMRKLVEEDVRFRRDYWSLEEARAMFISQGWWDAVDILRLMRGSSVALVSCGHLYAIEFAPLVASAGCLDNFEVVANGNDLLIYFGDAEKRRPAYVRTAHPGYLAKQHDHWLRATGLTSAGAFNAMCISGEVGRLIQVSEGFHEKRISQIADMILQREQGVKVICVSGPSSSGKTTFLKRLSIQLQVNGLRPKSISLDNYYVDRVKTVRDEHGDYDFEAFEALNCELLENQLRDLVSGKEIRVARYDFTSGKSLPEGGPLMRLGEGDVLMLEGIHALNPRLPSPKDGLFRIFINPMTSLALDHASRVSASDIRLLRRIVRDRHSRGITATDNIMRWPSVRRGEVNHIFPYQELADAVFNTSLVYEISVLKVYAERYLLEVDESHPAQTVAYRLRRLIDKFVSIYPDRVPQTSLLREFIGGSCFEE